MGKGKTILVVDDDPETRTMLREMLEPQGYAVVLAEDGVEALNKLEKSKFDLVLMDLAMPRMDGIQATREIRLRSYGSKLPVVAISAHTSGTAEEEAFDAGMDGYLRKPFTRELILLEIRRQFGG